MAFRFLFACFLFFITSCVYSQDLDSLKKMLVTEKVDTSYCKILNSMMDAEMDEEKCFEYAIQLEKICNKNLADKSVNKKIREFFLKYKAIALNNYGIRNETVGDIPKALDNYNQSLKIREELKDKQGIASSLNNIGLVYSNQGLTDQALIYFNKSLQIATEVDNKESIATTLNNIGLTYSNLGDIPKVLEYYHKSLKIREEIGNKEGIAISLNNIALVFVSQDDIAKALDYYQKSLKISEQIKNKKLIATTLNNIGYMYKNHEDYSKALEYYFQSLKIREELNNKVLIATSLNNIGIIYKNQEEYAKAMAFYSRALKLSEEANNKEGISNSLSNISNLLLKQEKFKEAQGYAERSLVLAQEIGYPSNIKSASGKLSKIYAKTGNYKGAYDMQVLYKQMSDSISNESTRKATVKSQFKYEYDKKATADSLKTAEEKKVVALQLKQEKTQRFALYGGLILVFIFAGFMFNRFKVTQKQKNIIELKELETQLQKNIIEEKHKEIHDSINYAKRIQYSLLASETLLNENLKNYFLFFKPKDIVSGDFYWGSKLNNGNFALVTADSTGHGVPGAIMSMLNISCLNEAINSDKLIQPADILNATRKKVIEHLSNDGSEEGGKDGMDCSLVVFDFKNKKLNYSSANNPVWIVRSNSPFEGGVCKTGNVEFISLVPDRMPIGKHVKDQVPFSQHEIYLREGDMIYTLTDGYPDQFGGPKGKKFKYKQLEELLMSIAHEPMKIQKQKLEDAFINWKGNMEQIDDVCIIGVKID